MIEWIKWSGAPLEDKKELVAYLQQLIEEEDIVENSDAWKKKCCAENPIDEFSSMCQECYDDFRLMVLEEEE